ncbi:hypothetical protein C8R44DRAFT_757338 [Mycena epipterygia]|nr:hypothetical protein C8R44DRAFT_757338 [Mycena epipterygia]
MSDALHWSFDGSRVLLPFIQLNSFGGFFLGVLLTIGVCALERLLTFASERHWGPSGIQRSRGANALWRAGLYGVLVSLRLAYMLVAMSMHLGLILSAVTTLVIGQFFIELRMPPRDRDYAPLEESTLYTMASSEDVSFQRSHSRSRSKPEDIFIHPNQSNIARADAAALNLGLGGTTERVQATRYPHEAAAWEAGKGPDVARSLLGTNRASAGPKRAPFQIGGDADSDSDSDS